MSERRKPAPQVSGFPGMLTWLKLRVAPEPEPIWGHRGRVGDLVRVILCDLRFLQERCAAELDAESREDLVGILADVQAVDVALRGRSELR